MKNPPAMQETWVRSLDWEDLLEKGKAPHSSILAWRIPMDRGAWRTTVRMVTKSWTRLSKGKIRFIHKVILPGEREGGKNWEIGIDIYIPLLYVKIDNLVYNAGVD